MKPLTTEWVGGSGLRDGATGAISGLSVLADLTNFDWTELRRDLDWLTTLAVEIRYPGADSTAEDAARAVVIAARVREKARSRLG